jgi:hypothetical protein
MKIIVKVNVFVMLTHFNRFDNLTSLVIEYVTSFTLGTLALSYTNLD